MSILRRVQNLPNHSIFGRTVGSLSCVVGLLCYAMSSSFKSLFGEWNPTKIVFYIILSSIISVIVLFEAKSRVSVVSKLKPHVEFLVLLLTSLYSFFADRSTKGKPDTWSVVSSGAFALTSLCLSLQIKPGFDVGLFSFFLGCVTVQLMEIHLIFILVAAGFCYPLVVLGSYSESQSENGDSSAEESLVIRIDDDANRMTSGFRYPPFVFWSYFEKWLQRPKAAATERFLSDLQERERWQPLPPQHQEQPPQRHQDPPPQLQQERPWQQLLQQLQWLLELQLEGPLRVLQLKQMRETERQLRETERQLRETELLTQPMPPFFWYLGANWKQPAAPLRQRRRLRQRLPA